MTTIPLAFSWDGDAMIPRLSKQADAQFVVGETCMLAVQEQRSAVSHRFYFASLHEAWLNLPEDQPERWPTCDHFRKWLLIRAGYRDERSIVAASKAEALRLAAFVRPMDDFAVVTVSGVVVTVATAKSQSLRSMGKAQFQASKQAVLDLAAEMIGVVESPASECPARRAMPAEPPRAAAAHGGTAIDQAGEALAAILIVAGGGYLVGLASLIGSGE